MAIHHITFRGECILAKQLINLIDESSNKIQPNGEVTVMIPIDKYFDLADLEVLRITAIDDEIHDSRVVEKDGIKYCAFETSHFSIYCLSDKLTLKEYIEIFAPYVIIFVSILTAIMSYQHLTKIKKHKT